MRGSGLVAASVAAALVVPACGSRTCSDVADDLVAELQAVLDEAADMSAAELVTPDGELPQFLQDVQARGAELEAEADELGCTDERMRDLVADRVDELEAEPGTVAELLLQFLTDEDFFEGTDQASIAPSSSSAAS